MDEKSDALRDGLWKMYLEHSTHLRHHESQRSTVAGAFVAIAAALLGLVTFDKAISRSDAFASLFLVALGVFGAFFSAKQWERATRQARLAEHYRDRVDLLLGGTPLRELEQDVDREHRGRYRVLSRLRIHVFWIALYLMIASIGGVLFYVALRPAPPPYQDVVCGTPDAPC